MQTASGPHPRTAFREKYLAAVGIVVLLLCSILGRAQIIQYPNPGAYGQGMHRFVPDSTLYFPTGCGAPSGIASLNSYGFTGFGQKIRQAAIYADTCGKHVYWFNWTDSSWRKLDTAGIGGGGTGSADSLKHLFVDTGSVARNSYYLGFDSVNRKWKLYAVSFYDSTIMQTKYRSDTGRTNVYAAIAAKLSTVATTNSVQGNGTPGSPVQLAGDANAPGASKYYGTDGSGAKGWNSLPSGVAPANPTAQIGLTPVNGSATTYMRSDAAPGLDTTGTNIHTDGLNLGKYKRIADSATNAASYTTRGWLQHILDSLNALSDTTNYIFVSSTSGNLYLTSFSKVGNVTNLKFYPVRDSTAPFFGWAPDSALILPFSSKITNGGGVPMIFSGLASGRPAAGTAGRIYISTDTKTISRDNGTTWDNLSGSGTLSQIFNVGSGYQHVIGGDSVRSLRCTGCVLDTATYGLIGITVSQPLFYILDYSQGHVPDSVTDFAPYFDSAFAHMPQLSDRQRGTLYLPAGTIYISRTVHVPSYVNIFGVGGSFPITGSGQSYGDSVVGTYGGTVIMTKGSYDAIVLDTAGTYYQGHGFKRSFSNVIENIMFTCDSAANPTAGAAIHIINGLFTLVENVTVTRFYDDIKIDAGFQYVIRHCGLYNPVHTAMTIGNNIEVDAGDFLVDDVTMSTNGYIGATYPKGVYYIGGGGGKFTNCKFNGRYPSGGAGTRFTYPFYIDMIQGQTSDIIITNSSIENYDTTAIYIDGHGTFANVIIAGIQTAGGGAVGTVVNIKNLTNAYVGDFVFGNNGTTVSANPMINFTSVNNATVGKGQQNGNYQASPLITGTGSLINIDYMWTQQVKLGNVNATSNNSIYSEFSDGTGLGTAASTFKNTFATQVTTSGAYNLAYTNFYSGNTAVRGILGTSYSTSTGSGGAAPFNITGSFWGTTTNNPLYLFTNNGSPQITLSAAGRTLIGSITDDGTNKLQVTGTTATTVHFICKGSPPSIASNTGAGTSPTLSITGNDHGGTITLTTGSSPANNATVATMTYTSTFPTGTYVTLTPANLNAAGLSGATGVYVTSTGSAFNIISGSTGLTASTQYIWNYTIVGN